MKPAATSLQALSALALQRASERQAIEFGGRWYSWGELRRVAQGVHAATAASGIADGAPVAFIPRNKPASIAALLALIEEGRTIRMIYGFQSPAGVARDLERLQPAAIVAHAEDLAPEVIDTIERDGLAAISLHGMDAAPLPACARAGDVARQQLAPVEPQIEILTSGTTGPPKHFAISYRVIEQHFIASPLARQQGENAETLPPFLLYFPLGNITGLYSTLPMMIRGQRVVLLERFTVEGWLDYVVRYRPAHSGLPPSCVQLVLDANIPKQDLASLKMLGTGAAPLDPAVQAAFEDRYAIPVLQSYGATEFAGPVAAMTAELHAEWGAKKLGSVGRAMAGAQVRIVDPASGKVLPPGHEGLIEAVSPRMGPDWIRTSDIAVIDEDGFLFHRGRADGAIMRGGFKILPETIERALMLHPSVSEVAVTGAPDPRTGEVPAAVICLKRGLPAPNSSDLEAHLRQHVLATHIPARWLFCKDLPRTPSLKVDRAAVRRMFRSS